MRAMQFNTYGGPEVLTVVDVASPVPAADQVLIKVAAAGLNPVDAKIRAGYLQEMMPVTFPAGSGSDAAGVVIATGEAVTGVDVGDLVFGTGTSTLAEEAVLTAWARVPAGVDLQQAAGWAGVVETAVRVLDLLAVPSGSTVLISGASGGVGTALVQLARSRGLKVIGSASQGNQQYLRDLGAVPVVYGDGLAERVAELAPEGVRGAFDVSGAGVLRELIAITGGNADAVVSIADFSAPEHGVRLSTGVTDRPTAFAEALSVPGFRIPVERTYSLDEADAAHEQVLAGHTTGKLVVVP